LTTVTLPAPDLSTMEFWALPLEDRHAAFAALRAGGGIHFFEEPELKLFKRGRGYYALSTHELVNEASCHPELFCSGKGTQLGDTPEPLLEFFGSMINLDDPRHARFRRIVGKAFTPRMLESFRDNVERAAADVIGAVAERGECDFVTDIAGRVPLRIINDMLGKPDPGCPRS
jgi:methyl-branched lipid omega-hydroxylase